jgi:hypothetical protein
MTFHPAIALVVEKRAESGAEKYLEIDFQNLKPVAQGRRNPSVRTT